MTTQETIQTTLGQLNQRNNQTIGSLNYYIAILRGHANNASLSESQLRHCMLNMANSLEVVSGSLGTSYQKDL